MGLAYADTQWEVPKMPSQKKKPGRKRVFMADASMGRRHVHDYHVCLWVYRWC